MYFYPKVIETRIQSFSSSSNSSSSFSSFYASLPHLVTFLPCLPSVTLAFTILHFMVTTHSLCELLSWCSSFDFPYFFTCSRLYSLGSRFQSFFLVLLSIFLTFLANFSCECLKRLYFFS